MILAIDTRDVRLVRLLMYYNYDLSNDKAANEAYTKEEFHLLKVLLLSGDRLTPYNQQDLLDTPLASYNYDLRVPLLRLRARGAAWLKEWLVQPHSLSFHCRKSIREHFKSDLTQLHRSIVYPRKLRNFLRTMILFL